MAGRSRLDLDEIQRLYERGVTQTRIAKDLGVARNTIVRKIAALRESGKLRKPDRSTTPAPESSAPQTNPTTIQL